MEVKVEPQRRQKSLSLGKKHNTLESESWFCALLWHLQVFCPKQVTATILRAISWSVVGYFTARCPAWCGITWIGDSVFRCQSRVLEMIEMGRKPLVWPPPLIPTPPFPKLLMLLWWAQRRLLIRMWFLWGPQTPTKDYGQVPRGEASEYLHKHILYPIPNTLFLPTHKTSLSEWTC